MMFRAHPGKLALGAWFDGEGPDRVGAHVLRCSRCQRHVSELSRLRSWLRAQPFFAMGEDDLVDDEVPPARGKKPIVVLAALLATFLVVADKAEVPRQLTASAPRATTTTAAPPVAEEPPPTTAAAAEEPAPGPTESPPAVDDAARARASAPDAGSVSEQALARSRQPSEPQPLRLGVIVPTRGTMAAEGAEVTEVVRQRVAAANAAGGVAGVPVELDVAAAEDAAAVAALVKTATVLVGGFGAEAPEGIPWLLPADPAIAGVNVIPAESPARSAGIQLGALLRRQGMTGTIGVIVGSGPDAALANGLATKAATLNVTAQESGTCGPEVSTLSRSGVVALAVAGSPDLAAKCMRAAFRAAWRPIFGTVLAPSAAYAGLQAMPEAIGARTVLGLPWPTSTAPGAARFRSTTSSLSYRALVSYAAAELAIDVARRQGGVSLDSVEAGIWRNDLIDLTGLTSRVNTLVVAFLGTWLIAG
ncbi:MAG: hypothetical protein ACR2MO_03675 [Acidimicrobiales bacterium]